jgi:hypothetical protein
MRNLISRITMVEDGNAPFQDIVSGDMIRYWVDIFGVQYMANNRFGFRVRVRRY